MPTWLSDPPRTALILLGVFALGAFASALFLAPDGPPTRCGDTKTAVSGRGPRRRLMRLAVIGTLAFLGLVVADWTWESDREQITRKLHEMSQGVAERNLDKVFEHISESFRYGSANKAALRARGESALRDGQVTEIPIWDIDVSRNSGDSRQLKVLFRFKIKGNALSENQFIGEGVFAKEGEEWRLVGVEVFSPTGTRDRYQIPGL